MSNSPPLSACFIRALKDATTAKEVTAVGSEYGPKISDAGLADKEIANLRRVYKKRLQEVPA